MWAVVSAILVPPYKLLFGWSDNRLGRKYEKRLVRDIKLSLPFLFAEFGGKTIPNDRQYPAAFDYVVTTVALRCFCIRFIRGRGELRVDVGPLFPPADWHDLSLILSAIGEGDLDQQPFTDLWQVSRLLEPHMEALVQLFSGNGFKDLKRRLEDEIYIPDRNATRVREAEINWRLYGDRR